MILSKELSHNLVGFHQLCHPHYGSRGKMAKRTTTNQESHTNTNSNMTRMNDDAPQEGDYAEYTNDYWNRVITETKHISQTAYTISYQYDVANRVT